MITARYSNRIVLAFLLGFAVLWAGCGGAQSGNASAASTGPSGPAMASFDDSHPKVVEAKERCQKEIDASETEPKEKLSAIQVKACMFALRPELGQCVKGPKTDVVLKVIIANSGSVISAFPIGDTADTPAAKCTAEVVEVANFPRFSGIEQQIVKYPFTLE